jgi:hypothetical protein
MTADTARTASSGGHALEFSDVLRLLTILAEY